MKLNLKSTIAAPADHNSCQGALNGIIGNTRHGIVVDKTLDPDSNNPVANKPVSTALAALAGQLAKGQVVFLDQLPERGEPHKIYVLTTTNQRYWWNGSAFIKIVPTASETNVPPTLNLLDMSTDDTPTVRTSITEEEKQNIEKGLYNSVLYADYSLGENGFYSTYFPENAIYANGNFIFSIYRLSYDKTSQSFSIISTRVYGITIGEKNSDGTYPIEIQRELEAPFSGSGSIGSSNDISHRLNLMNEDLSAVRTSITEEEKNNISKGLYHSVLYIDSSLGETASMSYRLPENAFHSNVNDRFGFSIYKVASNNSITGARIYELRIGEQGSDGTYPITVSKITDLLFGGDNLLQKPSGLTKTELVGVGASGQENIEIGDNLTLANGKLAAAGGSVSPTLNLIDFENGDIRTSITEEEYNNLKNGLYNSVNYYAKLPYDMYLQNKLFSFYDDSNKSLNCFFSSINAIGTSETDISSTNIIYQLNIGQKDTSGNYPITIEKLMEIPFGSGGGGGGVPINIITKGDEDNKFNGTLVSPGLTLFSYKLPNHSSYETMPIYTNGLWGTSITVNDETGEMTVYVFYQFNKRYGTITYHLEYHSHFITMTDSSSNIALYLTIQNASANEFNYVSLGEYLAGKKVLVNGNLHGVVPTYIAGEDGVIKVYYMTPGNNNINPQPDEFADLSSFEITDTVKLVE